MHRSRLAIGCAVLAGLLLKRLLFGVGAYAGSPLLCGINDAPALALADLGVAKGTAGSDVAIEAADIRPVRHGRARVTRCRGRTAPRGRRRRGGCAAREFDLARPIRARRHDSPPTLELSGVLRYNLSQPSGQIVWD